MKHLLLSLGVGLTLVGAFVHPLAHAQMRQPKGYHEHTLRADGIGAFTIGMTLDEMERASGLKFEITRFDPNDTDPPPPFENNSCYYVTPLGVADEISIMMEYGRMVRVDTYEPLVKTAKGVGVGSRDMDILAAYKAENVLSKTHFYVGSDGRYLIVPAPPNGMTGILFEVVEGLVVGVRAGMSEHIQYVEGCL
jgi:hypothetical protein